MIRLFALSFRVEEGDPRPASGADVPRANECGAPWSQSAPKAALQRRCSGGLMRDTSSAVDRAPGDDLGRSPEAAARHPRVRRSIPCEGEGRQWSVLPETQVLRHCQSRIGSALRYSSHRAAQSVAPPYWSPSYRVVELTTSARRAVARKTCRPRRLACREGRAGTRSW